jgi:hypothetical protein
MLPAHSSASKSANPDFVRDLPGMRSPAATCIEFRLKDVSSGVCYNLILYETKRVLTKHVLTNRVFMKLRIATCTLIGLLSGIFCWFLMKKFHQDAGDFRWAIRLARRLISRESLYDSPFEQYPLTAGLFAVPFVRLRPEIAAGLFYGISSTLLAFGLTKHSYRRLLIFLTYPYCAGLLAVQWSPIIAASAFFPLLLPITMAKPQIGIPVFLTRLTRRGLYRGPKSGFSTAVADALGGTDEKLRAFHSASHPTGPDPVACSLAVPGSRRSSVVVSGLHATALVFRQLYSVAHPKVAAGNDLDSISELGIGDLALVPRPT